MATCAAVTILLSTLLSVLYLTGAAETTPVAAGGLEQTGSMYAMLIVEEGSMEYSQIQRHVD